MAQHYFIAAGKIIPLTAEFKSLDTVHISTAFSLILDFIQTQVLQDFLHRFQQAGEKPHLLIASPGWKKHYAS